MYFRYYPKSQKVEVKGEKYARFEEYRKSRKERTLPQLIKDMTELNKDIKEDKKKKSDDKKRSKTKGQEVEGPTATVVGSKAPHLAEIDDKGGPKGGR